jgi:hypothetical protein
MVAIDLTSSTHSSRECPRGGTVSDVHGIDTPANSKYFFSCTRYKGTMKGSQSSGF